MPNTANDGCQPGRRERKKRATLLALKAAAIDLVCERGFANVTIEDIAEAVDVSERTFFNYFSSKEAAVVGEDPELIAAMCIELVALPRELSPLEALRVVLLAETRAAIEDLEQSDEGREIWMRRFAAVRAQPEVLAAYTKHLAVVERALTDALVERLGSDEGLRAYATLVTTTALGAVRVAGTLWGGDGDAASFLQLVTAAFDLLARGLPFDPPPPKRRGPHSFWRRVERDSSLSGSAARAQRQ